MGCREKLRRSGKLLANHLNHDQKHRYSRQPMYYSIYIDFGPYAVEAHLTDRLSYGRTTAPKRHSADTQTIVLYQFLVLFFQRLPFPEGDIR